MRTRKLLAALGAGVLATLALAAPAQANTVKPVVSWDDACGQGKVTVSVTTPGNEKVDFEIGAKDVTAPLAAGSIDSNTSQKTWPVESTKELTVRWKSTTGWENISAHTWSFGDKCKPTFEITHNPACDNQALEVTVKNPALDGVRPIFVGSRTNGMNTVIDKGAQATFTGYADFTIYATGGRSGLLVDTIHQYYKYAAATGCTGPQPTITATEVVIVNGSGNGPGAGNGTANGAAPKGTAKNGGNGALPVTGPSTGLIAGAGALLIGLGGIIVLALRRRRSVRFTA